MKILLQLESPNMVEYYSEPTGYLTPHSPRAFGEGEGQRGSIGTSKARDSIQSTRAMATGMC